MTFIEFLGFLISLIAFFFLAAKQAVEKRRSVDDEEEETSSEPSMHEALRSHGLELKREKAPSKKTPPPASRSKNLKKNKDLPEPYLNPHTPLVDETFHDVWTDHKAYALEKEGRSRAKGWLKRGRSLKKAIVIREILGSPKVLEK